MVSLKRMKQLNMKLSTKILLGFSAIAAAGVAIYLVRKNNTRVMLEQIADEGYETAHDVLFPNKNKRDRRLQYGPVFPQEG